MPAVALQDKKSSLAIQLVRGLDLQLSQVARPSRQSTMLWKNWLFAFLSHSSINALYTHEILSASRENFERETLEKNKIDSSTIFTYWLFKFLNSHPFHCYILERFISQNFSHHTHICEKAFWCFGKQFGSDHSYWLMLWVIAESGKLKKTKVRHNLVGTRSLEGLGTLDRLGLEGFLLFMYPNFIL